MNKIQKPVLQKIKRYLRRNSNVSREPVYFDHHAEFRAWSRSNHLCGYLRVERVAGGYEGFFVPGNGDRLFFADA